MNKSNIFIKEADTSAWSNQVIEELDLSSYKVDLQKLPEEETEILKIVTKSKDTTYRNLIS